jgi:hypothetical protein
MAIIGTLRSNGRADQCGRRELVALRRKSGSSLRAQPARTLHLDVDFRTDAAYHADLFASVRYPKSHLCRAHSLPRHRYPWSKAMSVDYELGAKRADEVTVLIPVYNDWESLAELVPRLDDALKGYGVRANVLVVDDASSVPPTPVSIHDELGAIRIIDVLSLRRSLGHQRAIAIGLAYLEDRVDCQTVVVMDADGEDAPEDVPRLLTKLEEEGGATIVFAERARRSEELPFRAFYALYKLLHYVLTGYKVRFGNFSAVPRRRLESLAAVSEIWSHYAAAAVRSRQPYCTIMTKRAKRLRGRSTMDFVALVTHGLRAISVYSDIVGVRLLVLAVAVSVSALLCLVVSVSVRLTASLTIPGWATYTSELLLVIMLQAVMLAFTFVFVALAERSSATFLPHRDYPHFINCKTTLYANRRVGIEF